MPDICHVESPRDKPVDDPVLSKAQMRFARQHRACPAPAAVRDGSVLFYRKDRSGTTRWLVGTSGEVLDVDRFETGADKR